MALRSNGSTRITSIEATPRTSACQDASLGRVVAQRLCPLNCSAILSPRLIREAPGSPNSKQSTTELESVFFPSLSRDILGKAGAVSRVRCAAQKSRALDTAPAFPKNPTDKKAKGRSSKWQPGGSWQPAASLPHKLTPPTPSALTYCGRKMVLTMGSTLEGHFQFATATSPSAIFIQSLSLLDEL